ncbi:hypothetical protein RhiirA1_456381 [Rhizophagus irregularis]|uniref:Uncharacterized protein n=1 Tax=Rhizophagus irregularis TaxID=588596 RepID=A0A2N0S0P2_9GLOM|nr:hypothetical protein RhiirA1_456381 [Rhizophagus irregularis]
MLFIRSSRIKLNQIYGSSIPLTDLFTHKELFQKGISKERILGWFKYIENKFIENLLITKKVKSEYQLDYNWIDDNANKSDLKTKNWILTFYDQMIKYFIGRIMNKPGNDKVLVEYWI